jgi:cation diffusion facilitator CzcD-associated flavoprotein CzcO
MPPSVAIIGAGFSGIGTAIKLKEAGVRDVALFDRGERVGGTWRENTYPGAACDVPSHLYSFSFEPRADWSRRFPPQHEVLEYLEHCVRKYGLEPFLRLGTEVTRAAFDEERRAWRIETGDGATHEADVLVAGTGQLSRPAYPLVPGIDDFGGVAFHSAHWRHDHDLRGREVAVLGTGASAIQFVPAIAPEVRRLTVFQRSAPYVIPKFDREYRPWHHRMFERVPLLPRLARFGFYAYFEAITTGFIGREPRAMWPLRLSHRALLRWQVRDRALREEVTPGYEMGCKRVLVSNDWYPALARPNVDVVTDRIREVVADGVVTEGGVKHAADTIIFGTGFATNDFLAPMEVRGLGGRELNETWRDGAEAYLGMTVAGFPNLFILYGPNTNLGSGSIIYMLESQVRYVVDAVRKLDRSRAAWLDVRPDVQDAFGREIQDRLRATVWQTGCTSWYVTESGRNTNNWPGYMLEYRRRTRRVELDDYRLVPAA